MRAVYASADALVFPTLEDVWGLVANEAILCGLPVLCSRYAGCAVELFPPESVFDPLNPTDFAAKLRGMVRGEIQAVDPSCLLSTEENANRIASAILNSLRSAPARQRESAKSSPATER
jgi:glycosyltransferase involved in cell wall biosynthesis